MKEVLARFQDEHALAAAIADLRERGYRRIDAVTPWESLAVEKALDLAPSRIPWFAGAVAAMCGFGAWLVLWWTNAYDYPLDVGARPLHSFWTDVPIIFETMILTSGIFAFLSFFAASRLPTLHHPWFDAGSIDEGFWLAIEAPVLDESLERALRDRGATTIEIVGTA